MAKKKIFGLTSVLLGAIASDGDMGTTLTELLGATAKDSASLIFTPPTTEDIEIEEEDAVYDVLNTANGKWELKLESFNVSAKTLGDTMGGTYTAGVDPAPDTWEAPSSYILKEMSAKVTTRNGVVIDLPRVKIMAAPSLNFAKGALGRLAITGTVMQPTKSGVSHMKYTDPS